MADYHEEWQALPEAVRDMHRGLRAVIEELEAIDWYNQRAALTQDESLRAVIEHNRDEEIEHASMALEWLRRRNSVWDDRLRTFLFQSGPITEIEQAEAAASSSGSRRGSAPRADLGLGDLKHGDLKKGS